MKTGYFARPFNYSHRSKATIVHIVNNDNKPICGYKPHKTMQFQWTHLSVDLMYVECKKCKQKWARYLKNKVYKELCEINENL